MANKGRLPGQAENNLGKKSDGKYIYTDRKSKIYLAFYLFIDIIKIIYALKRTNGSRLYGELDIMKLKTVLNPDCAMPFKRRRSYVRQYLKLRMCHGSRY